MNWQPLTCAWHDLTPYKEVTYKLEDHQAAH